MKILHVCLIVDNSSQIALRSALKNISTEYREYSWCEARDRGEDTGTGIVQAAREFSPDIIFMQLQDHSVISPSQIAELPGIKITWNGDVRNQTPPWAFEQGRVLDLSLFTNMRDVEVLRSAGINADYLQIGFDPTIYTPCGIRSDLPEIIFLGADYGNMFPLSEFRREMVKKLSEVYGDRFAAYGHGQRYPLLRELEEAEALRSCEIAINLSHFNISRYSSDRLYRSLGCGPLVLTHDYPDLEQEFVHEIHLYKWNALDDLTNAIDYYLSPDNKEARDYIADEGCKIAHAECTWDARMIEFKDILKRRGLI